MARSNQRFLKPKLLAQMATMELRVSTVVEGIMSGLHASSYRGMSVEFAEYRQYQPGDEPKKIDWKAYARSDKYVIKEYEDETNLDAYLILDGSASMNFASKDHLTKWQYGGILAASLAYILQNQKDQVGLVVLDEQIKKEMQPKNTRGHIIRLIGELEDTIPLRKTQLAKVLHQVASKINRRSMIILISDLLDDPTEVIKSLSHLQFGGNEVIVIQTLDNSELMFDFEEPTMFLDPETSLTVSAMPRDVKTEYLKDLQIFLNTYSEQMGKMNINYSLVNTSSPLDFVLLDFLGKRMKANKKSEINLCYF